MSRVVLAGLSAFAVGTGYLAPAGSAESAPQQVTIITPDPDRSCVGDVDTLYWSPPADVAGVTGYKVVREVITMNPPWTFTDDVGADQTSLTFTAPFGWSVIRIYARTSEGTASTPFATGSTFVGRPPQPMRWTPDGAGVGDGSATVPFRWPGPVELFTFGGLSNTVRVTASPGGASVETPDAPLTGVTAVFQGLTNGAGYTFTAVTFNECGSSEEDSSPTYKPGVGPSWNRATPPLTAFSGEYVYRFAAVGDPSPTYRLVGAPSWLRISPKGLLTGRPPSGTNSFSYSVVASNGVGIDFYLRSDIVAGPFTVEVRSPKPT